jgi:hypothetical protein
MHRRIYETKSYQTRELGAVATTMLVDLGASGWADCYCSAKKSAPNGAPGKSEAHQKMARLHFKKEILCG